MGFQGRYQILEMVSDGEARTFKARQTSSGRTVLLHQLWVERTPPNQTDLASLVFSFLRRATADEMKALIDMGEEAGRVFVVTEDQPDFHDLRQWLRSEAGAAKTAGKTTVPKSAPSSDSGAGRASGGSSPQPRQQSPASLESARGMATPKVVKPPVATPPPSKAKDEPGEFTKVFFGKEMPIPKARGPVSPVPEKPSATAETPPRPSPPAQSPGKEAPGDFTRIFFGADESKAMPASPAPGAEAARVTRLGSDQPYQPEGPGEFSRLFRVPQTVEKPRAAPSLAAEPEPPLAPPVRATEQEGPGEFTRLFQAGPELPGSAGPPVFPASPRPAIPMPTSSSQQAPGELTQLLQGYQPGKSAPTPLVLERPESVAPPPHPKDEEAKPGAFTMIFQQPPAATLPSPAASPSAAQTPPVAPQPPEADEYMRMFELPNGGAGASPRGAQQVAPPAAPQPAAGRAMPGTPMAPVAPPMAPSMPYVQMPVPPSPTLPQPQPYQIASPQFQQPAVPPAYAMSSQPALPQVQPMATPAPAPPQAVSPGTGKGKFLVPLIILGGLFVIAVVVIIVFALKH